MGMRPEHFEDAAVEEGEAARTGCSFRVKADVVESMGSEKYVYFDVAAQGVESAELTELAADAGMEDLPSHGGGQQVVARLSAESPVCPGRRGRARRSTPARSSCSPPTTAAASSRPGPDEREHLAGAGADPAPAGIGLASTVPRTMTSATDRRRTA